MANNAAGNLVEHFFRHESGRLKSVLIATFGIENIQLVEDAIQDALLQALESWRLGSQPDNPAGWLHRVARNRVIDLLRQAGTARRFGERVAQQWPDSYLAVSNSDVAPDETIRDSQLRMMFACCHESLPADSRVSLTLNTLCGFTPWEISRALLSNPETTRKRIYRAKQLFATGRIPFEVPGPEVLPARMESLHSVLYALFNEGYGSSKADSVIRRDVCAEAIRIGRLLTEYRNHHTPASCALLALMLFHAARFEARIDNEGGILLMDEQDRTIWDRSLIAEGFETLSRSAEGTRVTRYHLEAGIAAEHCRAACFEETDWKAILRSYDRLVELNRSPVLALNRAIVIAHLQGPQAGIQTVQAIRGLGLLDNYHFLEATLGELHFRCGHLGEARRYFEEAVQKANTDAEIDLISKKLRRCHAS